MKNFIQIQNILGELPAFPKIYLLGSTGAGKTTIVQNIMGTSTHRFPSVSQTRTTVISTEYVLSRKKTFKTTFIFKDKEEIDRSLTEIIETAIQRGSHIKNNEEEQFEEVRSQLDETPDERFRLKYMLDETTLDNCANYIIKNILSMTSDSIDKEEDLFQTPEIKSEVNHLKQDLFSLIIKKAEEVCFNHDIFSNTPYILKNEDRNEFINENKKLLKSDTNSISPIIEYARIEGNLLADWIPDIEIILIDGEGIGHNLKESKNSLSIRHLDFFNFSDAIVLVEKSDDPFISGGKSAIETIFLNGYNDKFKLIFTKLDKLDVKDKKRLLNTRIKNVTNALEENNIKFNIDKTKIFYFEQLDKPTLDKTKNEIRTLLGAIKEQFDKDTTIIQPLAYDFDSLFINLNTNNFLKRWNGLLSKEHWAVIKAFNRRMTANEGEYRYLKPVLEFQELIMREINIFLQKTPSLESETYNAQNKMKQKFSKELLHYIRENFLANMHNDWSKALDECGPGSGKRRSEKIKKIYASFVPDTDNCEELKKFKNEIKTKLIKSGATELSGVTAVRIKEIVINDIFGKNDIHWKLSDDINVLIGKNGTGKSTVFKLINAHFSGNQRIIEQFGNPKIKIIISKEYENGRNQVFEVIENAASFNIDIILIDTFDNKFENLTGMGEKKSQLDLQLETIIKPFASHLLKLKNAYEKKVKPIEEKIKKIMTDSNGDLKEAQNLYLRRDNIKMQVFNNLTTCKDIIDHMFKNTNKTIDFLTSDKGEILINADGNHVEITELSSGEKQLLIILLTVLLRENKPYVLLMDEPELSLHVEWQTIFIDSLRRLNSNIQIIIATHNPLLVLNRNAEDIGILEQGQSEVIKKSIGSKYLDVSATLLSYFDLSSLVGQDMKNNIEEFFRLNEKDHLSHDEQIQLDELKSRLDTTLATNFIYDRHYYNFLKFIKDNKKIDFDKFNKISEDEMNNLLGEYKELF